MYFVYSPYRVISRPDNIPAAQHTGVVNMPLNIRLGLDYIKE